MNRRLPLVILLSWLPCLWTSVAQADEALFGYATTTDSLPQDRSDVQQWGTLRAGKARGDYDGFDLRTGYGHGLSSALQGTLYLNSSYLHTRNAYNSNNVAQNLPDHDDLNINSVSLEMKYRLFSPYLGGPGVSVLVEPELGIRDPETDVNQTAKGFTTRLIGQQNFKDDRVVLVGNMLLAPKWTTTNGVYGHTVAMEYIFAGSYRFAPNWFIGGTLRNRDEFPKGTASYSTFYLGPNVHYGAQTWWATFDVLPQILGAPHNLGTDASGTRISDGSRYLGRQEKLEIRLRIGINLG